MNKFALNNVARWLFAILICGLSSLVSLRAMADGTTGPCAYVSGNRPCGCTAIDEDGKRRPVCSESEIKCKGCSHQQQCTELCAKAAQSSAINQKRLSSSAQRFSTPQVSPPPAPASAGGSSQNMQRIDQAIQGFNSVLQQQMEMQRRNREADVDDDDEEDDTSARLEQQERAREAQALQSQRRAEQLQADQVRRQQEASLRQQRNAEEQRQAQLQAEVEAKRRQLEELKAKQRDKENRAALKNPWAPSDESKKAQAKNPFE